jgi:hypothetical protein
LNPQQKKIKVLMHTHPQKFVNFCLTPQKKILRSKEGHRCRNDFFEPPQKFSSIEAGGGGGGGGEWTLNGMALRLVGMAQLPEKCKEKFSFILYFSGTCIPSSESLLMLLVLPILAQTVQAFKHRRLN